eukprot:CAMPEP_0196806570 /NCGR_PEP_ID=MMETSP1362-20130617/6453_1 /TAXON_ID=163516 /ORGANISM="Leptocylindrus danicus, Strain CCMP1856" /LENGTH=650 /DNA_ID=CAMNT_0042180091 /DNA_START=68 /DNA_END=2017 /DNA_ORIENTATION=+
MSRWKRRRENALAIDLANFLNRRATSSENSTRTISESIMRLAASQMKTQLGDNLERFPDCAERVAGQAAQYYGVIHSAEEESLSGSSARPYTGSENPCPDEAIQQKTRQQQCASFSLFDYLDQQAAKSNVAETTAVTVRQIIEEYEKSGAVELTVALFEDMCEIDFVEEINLDDNFLEFGADDAPDAKLGKKTQSTIKYMVDIMREGILNYIHPPGSSTVASRELFAGSCTADQAKISNRFIDIHWKYFCSAINNSNSLSSPAIQQELCSLLLSNLIFALKDMSVSQFMVCEIVCNCSTTVSLNAKKSFSCKCYGKDLDLFSRGYGSILVKLVKVLSGMLHALYSCPSLENFVSTDDKMQKIFLNLLTFYGYIPEYQKSYTFAIHPAHLIALEAPQARWFSAWVKYMTPHEIMTVANLTGFLKNMGRVVEVISLGQTFCPVTDWDANYEANLITGKDNLYAEMHYLKQALFVNYLSMLRVMTAVSGPLFATYCDFTCMKFARPASMCSRHGVLNVCNKEALPSAPPTPGRDNDSELMKMDEAFLIVKPFLDVLELVLTCEETKVSKVIANACVDSLEAAIMASSSDVALSVALLPKIIDSIMQFCKTCEGRTIRPKFSLRLFRSLCYRIMSHNPWCSTTADGARNNITSL